MQSLDGYDVYVTSRVSYLFCLGRKKLQLSVILVSYWPLSYRCVAGAKQGAETELMHVVLKLEK